MGVSEAVETTQAKRGGDDGGVQDGGRHGEEEENVPESEVVPALHDEDARVYAADGVRDDDNDVDEGEEHGETTEESDVADSKTDKVQGECEIQ